jgi:hypothetical protein
LEVVVNLLLLAAGGGDPDAVEGMAKSVAAPGVTARLCFVACCPDCGDPIPADQVKCPVCALL